jgi:hypothetical protein
VRALKVVASHLAACLLTGYNFDMMRGILCLSFQRIHSITFA